MYQIGTLFLVTYAFPQLLLWSLKQKNVFYIYWFELSLGTYTTTIIMRKIVIIYNYSLLHFTFRNTNDLQKK